MMYRGMDSTLVFGVTLAFVAVFVIGRVVWVSGRYRLRRWIWERNHPNEERI